MLQAMQAQPPPPPGGDEPKRVISFKEYVLNGPRGDLTTLPLIHNKWIPQPDPGWMSPSFLFYDRVLGAGLVERSKFVKAMEGLGTSRHTTPSEDILLHKHNWSGASTTRVLLVPTEELASFCEGLGLEALRPTVVSLRDIPGNPKLELFPSSIPACTIPQDLLMGKYSLSATQSKMWGKGTKIFSQVNALLSWKEGGHLGSAASARGVGDATLQILERSVDEYVGFCYQHLGLDPCLDLVMQPGRVAEFVAFQQARGNEPGTILRQAQQLSSVVPFVASGRCPRAKAWGHSHSLLVSEWYSSLKAIMRAKARPLEHDRVDPRQWASLWEHLAAQWAQVVQSFKVSSLPGLPALFLLTTSAIPTCPQPLTHPHPHLPSL